MNNNAVYLKIQLMKRFITAIFNGDLKNTIDAIPVQMFPRNSGNYRCCTYKDRAVTRYRLMSLLGFRIEEETDETRSLGSYTEEAERRAIPPATPPITLIDAACSSCPSGRHTVSNLCRGCLARHCEAVCPRNAIEFSGGRASIKRELCVNCGKCRDACPYNAVVYTPVPCEKACPVGAIQKDTGGAATIDYERCISCGRCGANCPFGAVSERSQLLEICMSLSSKDQAPPVALVAPSAAGQFPGSFDQLVTALRTAGFSAVIEVAYGAVETVHREAAELVEHLNHGKTLTSSCCPAYTEAVRIHLPEAIPLLSTAPTPMAASTAYTNQRWPDRKTVFIGPCTAKRVEAVRDASADLVMTFEELAALFLALKIDVAECSESAADSPPVTGRERRFARAGGVREAVLDQAGNSLDGEPNLLQIDGLDRKALGKLKLIADGKLHSDFVEVMSCTGGCICGPGTVADPRLVARKLDAHAAEAGRGVKEEPVLT